jgi:hypothetical protein
MDRIESEDRIESSELARDATAPSWPTKPRRARARSRLSAT